MSLRPHNYPERSLKRGVLADKYLKASIVPASKLSADRPDGRNYTIRVRADGVVFATRP